MMLALRERLDRIKAFMATLGVRSVGDSQALRLALRRATWTCSTSTPTCAAKTEEGTRGRTPKVDFPIAELRYRVAFPCVCVRLATEWPPP